MDSTSAPLADYFWIAGIDSLSYGPDAFPSTSNGAPQIPSPQVDTTIEELHEGETPSSPTSSSPPPTSTARATARHSRNNSWNLLSKQPAPDPSRNSVSTLDELEHTNSNRSSITIKAGSPQRTNGNGNGNGRNSVFSDFDFDKALLKFASERETFLDDLSFSAGAPVQQRPPMTNPRMERLRFEDGENVTPLGTASNSNSNASPSGRRTPLRSVGGSIRRKISFRDMNSMKRQPSMVQRTSKWKFFFFQTRGGFERSHDVTWWTVAVRRFMDSC